MSVPQVNQRMTKKVVLKEYCAEIEHLRAQLQITREKNGVYVDPIEFESMESRIVAQEAQLLECEAVLRTRTEEVKMLRAAKEDLELSLEEALQEKQQTEVMLADTQDELARVKAELRACKVELGAAEAVVSEQTDTEHRLLQGAQTLQSELLERRSEVCILLQRVDQHSEIERRRVSEAESFLSTLCVRNQALLAEVEAMVQTNGVSSKQLCNGIIDMISRGQNTCSTLTQAIEEALSTLTIESEQVKNKMTGTCTSLSEHLKDTNASLQTSLRGMQSHLSCWLQEVDQNLNQAKLLLKEQQTQVSAGIRFLHCFISLVCYLSSVPQPRGWCCSPRDMSKKADVLLRSITSWR